MKGHSGNTWALHQRCRITTLRLAPHCFNDLALPRRRVFSGPLLPSFSEPEVAYTVWPLTSHVNCYFFHTIPLEYACCPINSPPRQLCVSQKLPVTAIKIRADLNQKRNLMC